MYILIYIQDCISCYISTEENFLKARFAREHLINTGLYRTGLLTWIKKNTVLVVDFTY